MLSRCAVEQDDGRLFIFTLKNALKLLEAGLIQESMFVLVFALFQGFFRAKYRLLDITFWRTIDKYMACVNYALPRRTCKCLENRRPGAWVTMFPTIHMERMTVTVAVVMGLILALPNGTAVCLNRCSTHPLENFFGTLRTYCSFKHSYSNISNKVAMTQLLRSFKEELGITPWIRTRVSVAGRNRRRKGRCSLNRLLSGNHVAHRRDVCCRAPRRATRASCQ